MKVYIAELLKSGNASVDVDFNEKIEGLDQDASGLSFNDPVSFTGKLTSKNGRIRLEGIINAGYYGICFRCLKDVSGVINAGIDENFVKAGDNDGDDTYTYAGKFLELDKAVADTIHLSIPMRILCEEGCKGICPTCGADLNETRCGCGKEPVNLQMEKLKQFFERKV